ncbi:MAG TPA: hypothetical protein VIC33_03585 [Vicinamibacterales bacterium]|jgi:hypothetical protein
MMLFLFIADLHRPAGTYAALWDALQEHAAVQVLDGGWIFRSPRTAVQLLDELRELTDAADRLMVVHLRDTFAWANLMDDGASL